jgi:hypothetical protein
MSRKKVDHGGNEAKKLLREKIRQIKEEILKAAEELKSSQSLDDDIMKKQQTLRKLIQTLETIALRFPQAAQSIGVQGQIEGLIREIEFPNLPRQDLSPAQLRLQEQARPIIDLWSRAGRGVDYDSLLPAVKEQVDILIEASELSTILTEQLQGIPQFRGPADASKTKILLESIKKLFQKKIAESCINDGREIDIDIRIEDHRRYLKTLAATSVGSILKSLTGPLSTVNVLFSAAASDPAQFVRDTGSLVFAGGVLTQCLPQGSGEGVRIVSDIAGAITAVMAHNPLEAFVSGKWTITQIRTLYEMALRQMYPELDDPTIMGIVNGMNADFLRRSRVGLTGEAPVDIVTLTGKLRYLIYLFKDICVGQAAFTGDIFRQALGFPNALCRLAKHAIAKLKSLSASASTQLMGRYQIIPGESLETFEDLLMNLMKMVEFENKQDVAQFIARLIQRNNVPTVWEMSVDFWMAQSNMLNPITGNAGSDSLECAPSRTPQTPLSPARPFEEFGILPDEGTIPAQRDDSSEYMWGNWLAVFRFLHSPPLDVAPDLGARASAAAAAAAAARLHQPGARAPRRLPPLVAQASAPSSAALFHRDGAQVLPPAQHQLQNCARGGGDYNDPPFFPQAPPAFAAAGNQPSCTKGGVRYSGTPQGGRSHSHKRSASKRTRRKGVAKKEKSKKNKRQSRRKVRRASSHKSRK